MSNILFFYFIFFFFNDTATTEIYTLSLHDALPIYADLDDLVTRMQLRRRLADRVVGGQAGVGERGHVGRGQPLVELDDRADRRPQQFGHAAVAVDPRELGVGAVDVVAGPAGPAQSAGDQRMQDDPIAFGDASYRCSGGDDRAGVLVTDDVRQLDAALLGPLPLDDVEVGPTDPGCVDMDEHVERALDGGLRDVVEARRLVVLVDSNCLHRGPPRFDPGSIVRDTDGDENAGSHP